VCFPLRRPLPRPRQLENEGSVRKLFNLTAKIIFLPFLPLRTRDNYVLEKLALLPDVVSAVTR
jgi:hypothetical protein